MTAWPGTWGQGLDVMHSYPDARSSLSVLRALRRCLISWSGDQPASPSSRTSGQYVKPDVGLEAKSRNLSCLLNEGATELESTQKVLYGEVICQDES